MRLLLADGSAVDVTELPGRGPWTFLVAGMPGGPSGPPPGEPARFLTRFGRAVVPDLRGRPAPGPPGGDPALLALADDLDAIRARAGLGRPILVGLGDLAPVALRAAADQPWAWRGLLLAPASPPDTAGLTEVDLPVLLAEAPGTDPRPARVGVDRAPLGRGRWAGQPDLVAAVAGWLGRLGSGPGWAGIAPGAPPR